MRSCHSRIRRTLIGGLLLLPLVAAAPLLGPEASRRDPYPRQPGIDILHYDFGLTLSDLSDRVAGETDLRVHFLADGLPGFELDLAGVTPEREGKGMTIASVEEWSAGDWVPVAWTHRQDRLRLEPDIPIQQGQERRFRVRYAGVPADGLIIGRNRHGDRTFFGDNWPDRAHQWLPTVDHVADKATCAFLVTAPDHYRVIGSGRLDAEDDLGNGQKQTVWRSGVPLATKVMVIGVADFAVQDLGTVAGVPLQTWVYVPDRETGFRSYAVAARVLPFYVETFGPFPYEKLANVQSTTRYGGMENAGNIFYSESTGAGERDLEGLFAHEIAHQWFGDSVTEGDWWHIWLSEGFATYLTHLYLEHAYGPKQLEDGLRRDRSRVFGWNRRHPNAPVIDTTITDLDELLSTNSYQKGSWALHMLRDVVGDRDFFAGLRRYYTEYRDRNALTADFRRVMEEVSGRDLGAFFKQWLWRPGHPVLEVTWRHDPVGGAVEVDVVQRQPGGAFRFPLELGIYSQGSERHRIDRVAVRDVRERFRLTVGAPPDSLVLDPRVRLLMEGTIAPEPPAGPPGGAQGY